MFNDDISTADRVRRSVVSSDSAKLVNMDVWYATTLWLTLISGWIDPSSGRRTRNNPNGGIIVRPVTPPALLVPPSSDESYSFNPNGPIQPALPSMPKHFHEQIMSNAPYHRRRGHRLLRRQTDANEQFIRLPRNVRSSQVGYHVPHSNRAGYPYHNRHNMVQNLPMASQMEMRMPPGMEMAGTPSNQQNALTTGQWNPYQGLGQLPAIALLPAPGQESSWNDIFHGGKQPPMSVFLPPPGQPGETWNPAYGSKTRLSAALRNSNSRELNDDNDDSVGIRRQRHSFPSSINTNKVLNTNSKPMTSYELLMQHNLHRPGSAGDDESDVLDSSIHQLQKRHRHMPVRPSPRPVYSESDEGEAAHPEAEETESWPPRLSKRRRLRKHPVTASSDEISKMIRKTVQLKGDTDQQEKSSSESEESNHSTTLKPILTQTSSISGESGEDQLQSSNEIHSKRRRPKQSLTRKQIRKKKLLAGEPLEVHQPKRHQSRRLNILENDASSEEDENTSRIRRRRQRGIAYPDQHQDDIQDK